MVIVQGWKCSLLYADHVNYAAIETFRKITLKIFKIFETEWYTEISQSHIYMLQTEVSLDFETHLYASNSKSELKFETRRR